MTIQVNGLPRVISELDAPTLDAVVRMLELTADRIAVELNGEIARRPAWQNTFVNEGDRLEIVHFVGGGAL